MDLSISFLMPEFLQHNNLEGIPTGKIIHKEIIKVSSFLPVAAFVSKAGVLISTHLF
jgi:hypothetical protein